MDPVKVEKLLQLQTYGMYYEACYLWAKFLAELDIAWLYCPGGGRRGILDRVADFYLPDQDAYLIIDAGRPDRGYTNCRSLSKQAGKMIISGGLQGLFSVYEDGERYSGPDSWLCRCAACGRYFFLTAEGDYTCKVCGEYEGDHHLSSAICGDRNFFKR